MAPSGEHHRYDGMRARAGSKEIRRNVMSDDELGLSPYRPNTKMGIMQEKGKSVLDTPAPRSKPPTPTVLDDTQRSDVRGHFKEHVTPDRKNKGSPFLMRHLVCYSRNMC